MTPMHRVLCLSALVVASSAGPSFAQRAHVPDTPCQGLANAPRGQCLDREYKKAQDELRAFLLRINRALANPEDRKRLGDAQAAWIRDSDRTCDADAKVYFGGGSGESAEFLACSLVETSLRLDDLHAIYDWKVERGQ